MGFGGHLGGVIAAIPTPVTVSGEADLVRLRAFAKRLVEEGCHGLNLLGTTGEANSMTVRARIRIMEAMGDEPELLARMMVGTGASSLVDAVELTRCADDLGFAGVLILPPFYYKAIGQAAIADWIARIVDQVTPKNAGLYLYNFPQMTGLTFEAATISLLQSRVGPLLAGFKDSSGDLTYAADLAKQFKGLSVFPSDEASLLSREEHGFAGCISATVNIAPWLARAVHDRPSTSVGGDELALMVAIRKALSQFPLVAAVKAAVAGKLDDPAWALTLPPLQTLSAHEVTVKLPDRWQGSRRG